MDGDVIHTVRTKFTAGGEGISTEQFATETFKQVQQTVLRQMVGKSIISTDLTALLHVDLGSADKPQGDPLLAYVNAGRWLVRCDVCGGCEYADWEQQVFMCCSCWNVSNGHAWRPVTFPTDLRADIEAVLLERDVPNRGWKPTETVEDLAFENIANDVAVPDAVAATLKGVI